MTQTDFERVLDVVRLVGEARDPDEFAVVAVKQLAGLVPSDAIALNEVDPEAGRLDLRRRAGVVRAATRA